MPSVPRIPKEKILDCALAMLIRDGSEAITIKAVAQELGCSTQPISWHFGSMEGLRAALSEHAREHVIRRLHRPQEDAVLSFFEQGMNYLDIALEEPHLFRYVFMNDCGGYTVNSVRDFSDAGRNAAITESIAGQLGMTREQAALYVQELVIYVHGLACYMATGVVHITREEAKTMLSRAGAAWLQKGAQADEHSGS